jgi:site-specific recombinase XerD
MEAVKQLIGRIEWIRRYSAGPFPEERNAYLAHLQKIGHSVRRMRDVNRFLLGIAEQVDLSRADLLDVAQIRQAGEAWVSSHCKPDSTVRTRQLTLREFTHIGERWLRFLGKWCRPERSHGFQGELGLFLDHLKDERGYTEQTLLTRSTALSLFFNWLTARGSSLEEVRSEAVAAYFAENKDRCWSRATIAVYAQSLRSFFRFAEQRGWCIPGIASRIERPRIYTLSGLPQGPSWRDVQRLIASVDTNRPSHIRDRAVILLLAVYGWRIGEVAKLALDDIDWRTERIYVKRLKRRSRQEYPLVPVVGDAILRYLKDVRPRSPHREIFLTLMTPHRPSTMRGLEACIALHIRALGLRLPHSGPHILRHACATHLLSQGFSIKEIGDHMGHESPRSTQIYAKVDERGLRQVADVDIAFAVEYVTGIRSVAQPKWTSDRLASLREVGNVSLGGVL